MEKLKKHIHDDSNGLDYVLVGDYYIPDLQLPEESRPIGRWGRMHREYLQEYCSDRYNELLLSGKLFGFLSSLDRLSIRRKAEKSSDEIFSKGICILSQNSWIIASVSVPICMACSKLSLTSSSVGCGSAVVLSFK